MKVGIVDLSDPQWSAGVSFTKMIAYSVAAATQGSNTTSMIISNRVGANSPPPFPVPLISASTPKYSRGEYSIRKIFGIPPKNGLFITAQQQNVSVLLPIFDFEGTPSCPLIGWIPDFQQLHCPEYFTKSEIEKRQDRNRRLAETATLILLSSQAAGRDFTTAFPAFGYKGRVIPFPSLFAFEPPNAQLAATRTKYHLPEKFILVANQFWPHKNHAVVILAIAILARRGLRLPVVFTGLPLNYLDRGNQTTSDILQSIARENLTGQIFVLGMVSSPDFISLLRSTALVIQPSRFEGWNTTVEDAKALGRPLLCSDIPVLREQAPQARGFFPCDAPESLAELLEQIWPNLTAGPDFSAEAQALVEARNLAQIHGQALLQACKEASSQR